MATDLNYYPYPLGRKVEHDPRSRAFAIPAGDPRKLASVKWNRYAPVFDQGSVGSCTGNATLGGLGSGILYYALRSTNNLPSFTQQKAVEIYSRATELDQWPGVYPPDDTGSSNLAAAKAVKEMGYIDSYYHAFSFDAALNGLSKAPVLTGVNWYTSFFYPNMEGECYIATGSNPAGGHAIVMDELDMENRRVWFTNSWGPYWGRGGRGWFSFETWERLLREYGDVTMLMPVNVPIPLDPDEPAPEIPEVTPDGCLATIAGPWATKVLTQRWQTKKNKKLAQSILDWMDIKNLTL